MQQKDINAFALPGGPVFVNVGTIMAAENEAELAGVIAHEMSHVYMQHSIKGMRKQGTTQAAGQILGADFSGPCSVAPPGRWPIWAPNSAPASSA